MRTSRLLRATSFRLAVLQTLLFLAAFALAGVIALLVVRRDEAQAVDAEITQQMADLQIVYDHGGIATLQATIEARQRDPSIWEFRAEDARRTRLAGDLPALDFGAGWSTRRLVEGDQPGDQSEVVRSLTRVFHDGPRMTVGEDLGQRERSDNALLGAVASIAAAAALLSLIAGALVGRRALRRVDAMALAIGRFGAGELGARVAAPTVASSDLDQLAAALNQMMDRTSALMEGMRQISADIAHDLRRPLAHHNQQIARVLAGPVCASAYRRALEAATVEVDEVLRTFQALLHIAELEAGAPGLELEPVDLGEVASRIVQAYAPSAEQGGRTLVFATASDASASSDPRQGGRPVMAEVRLMSQLVANLVENALTHTPAGVHVRVEVDAAQARISVTDDGPGVPTAMLTRVFERFVRLDASRSTPGTGLGLAVSAAIVTAFGGRLYAEDARPGLRVIASF